MPIIIFRLKKNILIFLTTKTPKLILKFTTNTEKKISEWRQQYEKENDPKIFFDVSEFLKIGWVWHINNTDRAYVPLKKTV